MTVQITSDQATEGGATGVLADVRRVFNSGRTRPLSWRSEQLRAIERMCDEREPEIAEAIGKDLGRPAFEAWLGDVGSTKAEAAFARKHLKKWVKPKRQGLPLAQLPGRAWVQYDPLGVVLVIGPWNYPFYLCMAPLVAAVAAGNAAVIKPSELAPATSAVIARLVPEYLDSDAIRVVEGDASTTQDLLAQGFDHALFTGGTEIGRKIMAAAAPTLTPVTLELGGKSPVVVLADADLDVTARRIAWTKLLNSGQTCIAPDYVLADRTIAAPLAEKIVATIAKFRAGEQDPSLRIVNERQFDRLVSLISATSGKVVTGGGSDRSTLRIEPTVVVDPAADDPVMSDEIFGPILPILTVDSPMPPCSSSTRGPNRWRSTSSPRISNGRVHSSTGCPRAAPSSTTSRCTAWCHSCRSAVWAPAGWVPTTASGASRRSATAAPCWPSRPSRTRA